ncbi:MAG TPA: DUF924 family protein [Casimicrobiaceae bacterium]|nr:DUF924 family protein [Casimicrobiaceae bacterium]
MSLPPLAAEILDFWFPPGASGERREWFQKDPAFDGEIRERFGTALAAGLAGAFGDWCTSPRGALARIVLLDQYTRNAFRDTPAAFAGDPAALATAEDAIAQGFDRELVPRERAFMYMPFQHSESLLLQERSVALFAALASDTGFDGQLPWAQRHRDVVRRFGRFPHRNDILGRASTPEEIEFLRQPGSRF